MIDKKNMNREWERLKWKIEEKIWERKNKYMKIKKKEDE